MRRFKFGKNWTAFSQNALTDEGIEQARKSFSSLFDSIGSIQRKRFLDIGFGQGLSANLASEMGANVDGVDIDSDNMVAARETATHFRSDSIPSLRVDSILDDSWVKEAGEKYDIVHSWGVLHHTGDMDQAIKNAAGLVKPGGWLVIAIYNYHWTSPIWKLIKRCYVASPGFLKRLMISVFYPIIYICKFLVTRKNPVAKERGMDFYYDVIDWVGGYPYEYASISELQEQICSIGFDCHHSIPAEVPIGCNEFVFQKHS